VRGERITYGNTTHATGHATHETDTISLSRICHIGQKQNILFGKPCTEEHQNEYMDGQK
jgi:hypothetical protein